MMAGLATGLLAWPPGVRAGCVSFCPECCKLVDDVCPGVPASPGPCDPPPIPQPPDPPEADDTTFVWVNNSSPVDCDPIGQNRFPTFPVSITRYVGKTFSRSGLLREPQAMVDAGVLGPTARLTIQAWDVDRRGSACGGSEVDLVYLNIAPPGGKSFRYLGRLRGSNRAWSQTVFYIPIGRIKFPEKGVGGSGPRGFPNKFLIRVDVNGECWCTRIGWISLEIQAMSPVVLLHGLGEDKFFWDVHENPVITFTDGLDAKRIPWDNNSTHTSELIAESARRINTNLATIRREWGVDGLHLVAHSKGGLDALRFLTLQYLRQPANDKYDILSLTTLDSPLQGSVLADVLIAKQEYGLFTSRLKGFPEDFWTNIVSTFGALASDNLGDLATYHVAGLMEDWVPMLKDERFSDTIFIAYGGDMDRNANKRVDGNEAKSLTDYLEIPGWITRPLLSVVNRAANLAYQVLAGVKGVADARLTCCIHIWGLDLVYWAITPISTSHQGNDVLVTLESALGNAGYRSLLSLAEGLEGTAGRTHANIASADVAEALRPFFVLGDLGAHGDLRPFRWRDRDRY